MSVLEITLSILLFASCFATFRMYQTQTILRHQFIHSSDWCGRKIAEMTECASGCIADMAEEQAKSSGRSITKQEAEAHIPFIISQASSEWWDQKEAFQNRLSRNGIHPLGANDLDLELAPRLSGYRN